MKKVIIGIIIALVVALVVFGVIKLTANDNLKGVGEKGENVVNSILGKKLETTDLVIDDFAWEVNPKVDKYSDRGYAINFTNNSKYDVIGVEIDYKTKEGLTDEQLKIFDEFRSAHEGFIHEEDSNRDVSLIAKRDILVKKGESLEGEFLYLGHKRLFWNNSDGYPTKEQFDLMEPSVLELGIAGEDSRLYIAYYDFVNKSWSIYDESKKIDVWPDNDLAKKIQKPECDHFILKSDEDDNENLDLICYNVSEEVDKAYIESVRESGFTINEPSYYITSYLADDADGNKIEVRYDSENNRMLVFLNND